jgi:hypothetical protein
MSPVLYTDKSRTVVSSLIGRPVALWLHVPNSDARYYKTGPLAAVDLVRAVSQWRCGAVVRGI